MSTKNGNMITTAIAMLIPTIILNDILETIPFVCDRLIMPDGCRKVSEGLLGGYSLHLRASLSEIGLPFSSLPEVALNSV